MIEMLNAGIDSAWGYVAFGLIFLGVLGALVMIALFGGFAFRWAVLKCVEMIRRRALYRTGKGTS